MLYDSQCSMNHWFHELQYFMPHYSLKELAFMENVVIAIEQSMEGILQNVRHSQEIRK